AGTLRSGLDPSILGDIAIIGAEKIARGAKNAADLGRALAADLGAAWEKVKGSTAEIWKASKDLYDREVKAANRQVARQLQESLRRRNRQTASEAIEKAVNRGTPLAGMGRQINLLAEEFVRQGVS